MNQLEILNLAQDELLRRYESARKMVQAKPNEITRAYHDRIMNECLEVNRLIVAERERMAAKAEQRMQAEQQRTQVERTQEQHEYKVSVQYKSGTVYEYKRESLEIATRTYNYMKDLMGSSPLGVIVRVSLMDNNSVIRSCEKGDF